MSTFLDTFLNVSLILGIISISYVLTTAVIDDIKNWNKPKEEKENSNNDNNR